MKRQICRIFHMVLIIFIVAAFIGAFRIAPVKKVTSSQEKLVPMNQWEQEVFEIAGEKYSEYTCTIPKNTDSGLVLSIKGFYSSISVFLNGENIYSYKDTYREKGGGWKWVDLPDTAAGQVLTVDVYNYNTDYVPVLDGKLYLGEKNAVFISILKENVYELFWGCITILAGVVICFSSLVLRKRVVATVRKGIDYLGIFMLLAGIWIITDSCVLQFVTKRAALVYLVSFICFMLMPYFLLMFIEKMMFYEKRGIALLCHLHLINMAICLFLNLFHLSPLYRTLPTVHILIVISAVVILKNAVAEIRRYENKEIKKISIGLIILGVFCGIALAFFYYNQSSLYVVFYGVGIFIFMMCLIGASVDRLHYYLLASASAKKYQEIAYMDIMTHMGNRMAFLKQQETGNDWEKGSCMVLDINDLKLTNDQYGHQEGDRLIVDAADCIQSAFASLGKCYRIGGDEFAVILATTSEEEILSGIEKLKLRVKQKSIGRIVPVKIAYGYAVRRPETESFQDLFNEADANMYARKQKMKKMEKQI